MNSQVTHLTANIRTRVLQNQTVHIKRVLPGKGKITVKKNEEIKPYDILGSYILSAGFSSINIAKKLGVNPKRGEIFLQKPLGSTIFRGELLALRNELIGQKTITAPTDGYLDSYNQDTGELRIRFLTKELKLTSGVFGIVDDVNLSSNEILIKTFVTQAFGLFGSGIEREGILNIISTEGNIIQAKQIQESMSNQILVAGALIYGDALKRAIGIGVQGVITGGISAYDYKSMVGVLDPTKKIGTDEGISIVATEGYGPIPIGDDIFQQLKNFNGKYVFVNGNQGKILLPIGNADSILSLRKIALPIKKSPESLPEIKMGEIEVGQKVRVIWPPFMGAQGKVLGIDASTSILESGLKTFLVTVETKNRKIKVPFTNLEILI